jgi:thiosulfate/3-mercaptopyruvate sulfurtransferase
MMTSTTKYISLALAVLAVCLLTGCSGEKDPLIPGVLVSTEWLQDHLNDPGLVLLHSGTAELFDTLHIPGARLISPYNFTVENESRRNELPPSDSIIDLLRGVGVNNESRIVLYYEAPGLLTRTSRLFLSLDHVGLGKQTSVLNGGLTAWQEEERMTTDAVIEYSPGNLSLGALEEVVITSNELDKQRWNPDVVVIDARTDEEYFGSPESADTPAEGGHIEGAYFLPYQDLLMGDRPHMFRPDREMLDLFQKVGMDPKKTTVVYCGSGIRATASYLAARHLGYPTLLYDGSYEEWLSLDMPLTGPVTIPEKKD